MANTLAKNSLESIEHNLSALEGWSLIPKELLDLLESVNTLKKCCSEDGRARALASDIEECLRMGFLNEWRGGGEARLDIANKINDLRAYFAMTEPTAGEEL